MPSKSTYTGLETPASEKWLVSLARFQAGNETVNQKMKYEMEEDIQILRELLWLHHGHPSTALYGDDGEMQCAACLKEYGFYDWKRTPIKEIQKRIYNANMKKLK